MAAEVIPIDISNDPVLRRLVEEARKSNTPRPVIV